MKWLIRQFSSGFARKLGFIAAAVLVGVLASMGQARAQVAGCTVITGTGDASAQCVYRDKAYAWAQSASQAQVACGKYNQDVMPTVYATQYFASSRYTRRYDCKDRVNGFYQGNIVLIGFFTSQCPTGSTFDDVTKTCHNPQQCLAKNDALSSAIQTTAPSTNGCDQGCATSMGTDYVRTYITLNGQEVTAFRGQARFTGAACTTPTKPPESQEPECFSIDGQTACKRAKDGKICAQSATTKEYFCWGPTETGKKTSGPDAQERKAGNDTTPPPSVLLPNGDTLNPQGPGIKTSSSKPGVPGSPVTNTVIFNSTTVNGTSPAPDGGKAPGDGEGGTAGPGEGGDGDGDGDGSGTVSGGDTCGSPPVITGGDPIAAAGIMQTWRLRCDGKDDQAKTDFDASVAAALLNGDEEAPAGFSSGASGSWGGAEGTWADSDDPLEGARIEQDESDLLDKLNDDAWFGTGGECPQLPALNVGAINLPLQIQAICDLLSALSGVLLAVAYLKAFRIMAGS